ncbi:hypothetical protein ACSVHC_17185 [Arthrobacter sp. KNU-44]|uniref:hypothetical protein n=1 Tax=Arthrobacter sp. KNU-44 TaxID=3450744 RepID=UPI003F4383ED
MNKSGAAIPTAWLLIIPIANIVWPWKYSVDVESFTRMRFGRHAAFWLMLLLGGIGSAIMQNQFNKALESAPTRAQVAS